MKKPPEFAQISKARVENGIPPQVSPLRPKPQVPLASLIRILLSSVRPPSMLWLLVKVFLIEFNAKISDVIGEYSGSPTLKGKLTWSHLPMFGKCCTPTEQRWLPSWFIFLRREVGVPIPAVRERSGCNVVKLVEWLRCGAGIVEGG